MVKDEGGVAVFMQENDGERVVRLVGDCERRNPRIGLGVSENRSSKVWPTDAAVPSNQDLVPTYEQVEAYTMARTL